MSSNNTDWPPHKVQQSLQRLRDLKQLLDKKQAEKQADDDAVTSNLAKLLVVCCSGHLEVVSSSCIIEFMSRHADPLVSEYVHSQYKTWQSPKLEQLKKTLSSVSKTIANDFEDFLSKDSYGKDNFLSEIGSLVDQRNRISHGDNDSVTERKAFQYYDAMNKISDWFISYFQPSGSADKFCNGSFTLVSASSQRE